MQANAAAGFPMFCRFQKIIKYLEGWYFARSYKYVWEVYFATWVKPNSQRAKDPAERNKSNSSKTNCAFHDNYTIHLSSKCLHSCRRRIYLRTDPTLVISRKTNAAAVSLLDSGTFNQEDKESSRK